MVDINAAKHYQNREKHDSSAEFPPSADRAETKIRQQIYDGGNRFNDHVARRYFRPAEAALSTQDKPAEDGEHIVPFQAITTAEAVGGLSNNRLL